MADNNPDKKQLQKQMEKTRDSMAETVDEIKDVVGKQYEAAKETVSGVLDYREQFQKEPLVWSLGALSAGFALGYTMGYAHKETKGGRKKSEVAQFADSLVDELSTVGNTFVMPALNARIKELFGFDFSDALDSIAKTNGNRERRKAPKKAAAKRTRKRVQKTKAGARRKSR
jgi:hypothetical protein